MSELEFPVSGIAVKEVGHSVRVGGARDGQTAKSTPSLGKPTDPDANNFPTFTEWASEADCQAFDGT